MIEKLMKVFLLVFLVFTASHIAFAEEDMKKMYYILSDTCPVCQQATEFLDELEDQKDLEYEIIRLEISRDREEVEPLFEKYNIPPQERLVPLFIFEDDEHILGFNQIFQSELEERLTGESSTNLGIFNTDLESVPLILATVLIGTVDGFNPCSLWALMFLVSMVIRFNSRKKMAIVGGSFILTISLIYGLFMLGTFTIVVNIIDYFWFRLALFLLAMLVAIINIREGFGKTSPLSFTISNDNKKSFVKKVRDKLFQVESVSGLILASVTIAAFASFIELPCTAGFPVIWNGLVSSYGVGFAEYGFYLMIYLFMYILMELIIVIFMVWTMRKAFMGQHLGENLKLISGMLMGFLAIVLLMGYEYMNNIWIVLGGSIIVIAVSTLIMIIRRTTSKKKK